MKTINRYLVTYSYTACDYGYNDYRFIYARNRLNAIRKVQKLLINERYYQPYYESCKSLVSHNEAYVRLINICGVYELDDVYTDFKAIRADEKDIDVLAESMDDENADRCTDYYLSCTRRDYSPSSPWNAPGMSINDFIKGVY